MRYLVLLGFFSLLLVLCGIWRLRISPPFLSPDCESRGRKARIRSAAVYNHLLSSNLFLQQNQERIFSTFSDSFARGSCTLNFVLLSNDKLHVGRWSPQNNAIAGRFASDLQYVAARLAQPTSKRCSRCAIVGNSGNILGRGFGSSIDDHDIVFRMNDAPTKSYERDVGLKDTFRVMTLETCSVEALNSAGASIECCLA